MSAAGYNDMLEKYRDVDEDEIMSGLTKDELARLENEIDREILEKPPEYESCSESYTTATTTTEDSESEDEVDNTPIVEEPSQPQPRPRTSSRGKPEAFARGKLDKTQLKPIQKTLQRQKSKDKHTFKLPALKKTSGPRSDKTLPGEEGNHALKDELIQAVKKRDKRRTRRGNSSGIARRPSCGVSKARRNSRVIRYRDGNEHQVDAAVVNRNTITDEMLTMRPKLKKVNVKEPKLILPEELHGVSFDRITAGAKRKQEEEEEEEEMEEGAEPEPAISEDGNASRNSTFGYDADNDVTPSDDSYLPGEDIEMEEKSRHKAMSESSEAPSDGVGTMASTASTSAESCDVFGELSINPNSVEEMLERVRENDPTLTEVNLNNIHDVPMERFEELAEAMEDNTHVSSLSLANTGLTDRAAKALASMLKRNKTLKTLNVESNFITGDGGRRLVSALRKNNSLVELSLDNQRHIFGAKVEHEISKMLRENKSLLKFGYQFTNPGPRMATSSILTKNMDLVRKKRVAEEKQRRQAGQSKRPQLRRQPSSEWYRKERLERLKKLQEQSKLLGLNPAQGIGNNEVEKVLKNMNPDEVSLLERWFTSKLLGMVDKPPSVEQEEGMTKETKESKTPDEEAKRTKSKKAKESKDYGKPKPTDTPDDNHLRPPARSRRSKSPPASRDDLLDSIRNHNAKLKKVQLRPFESPTRIGNADSDAEIQPVGWTKGKQQQKNPTEKHEKSVDETNAVEQPLLTKKQLTITKELSGTSTRNKDTSEQTGTNTTEAKVQNSDAREKLSLKPSDKEYQQRPKSPQKSSSFKTAENSGSCVKTPPAEITKEKLVDTTLVRPSIVKTEPSFDASYEEPNNCVSRTSNAGCEDEKFISNEPEKSGDINQQRSSSPEICEWKEGEEYDSDEYEVVEIEVTDSEEDESEEVETAKPYATEEMRPGSRDTGYPTTSSNFESDRESPSSKATSPFSSRLAQHRPPPLSSSDHEPKSPAALILKSQSRSNSRGSNKSASPHMIQSPFGSRKSNPMSPLSPPSARANIVNSPSFNRSLSRSSNASNDSAKSSPRYSRPTPPRSTRPARNRAAEEEPQINPKALSTIESFFSFK